MARLIAEDELAAVLEIVRRHAGRMTGKEILRSLDSPVPLRTLQYRLRYLADRHRLTVQGSGRWATYGLMNAASERSVPAAFEGERPGEDEVLHEAVNTDSETGRIILQAAADVFLDHGYDASLDRIARAAGVTKPTIYTYFKDKDALFRAAMAGIANDMAPKITPPDIQGDLREELMKYARAFRAMVLSERQLLSYRAALANLREAPTMGRLMLRGSLLRTNRSLTEYFRGAIARGLLRDLDPDLLSEFFFAAATGQARTKRLMGVEAESPQRQDEYVRQMIDCFLEGAAPPASTALP